MKNNQNILVINTGGTFNKQYDEISGELMIKKNNDFLQEIMKKAKVKDVEIKGLLYKDSLEMTDEDRKLLLKLIQQTKNKKIVIVHGTDTMDKTAEFLAKNVSDKQIVLTGAMVPYSIKKVEAVANLMMGYGYLISNETKGVFISMHGLVKQYTKIKKNKKLGIFECQ